jgi:hypothetical protein
MALRFYKKSSPKTHVVLDNRDRIEFKTLDQVWGYCGTDAAYVHEQFEKCMKEHRYGISEISAEEFTRDYLDKKKAGMQPRKLWREEFGAGAVKAAVPGISPEGARSVAGAANLDVQKAQPGPKEIPSTIATAADAPKGPAVPAPAPTPGPVEFTPVVGKRKKATS